MATGPDITARVADRRGVTRSIFEGEIAPAGLPVVLKGLISDWPVVAAAAQSHQVI
jgi:hypothetical protein